jgi:formamidopyrimidine-DNA glycosylase
MPELPEVETVRRDLVAAVVGKTFGQATILVPKIVRPLSVAAFVRAVAGKKITTVDRRAKVLLIQLTGDATIAIHLKMTGQLIYKPKRGKVIVGGHPQEGGLDNLPNKFTRAVFPLSDGTTLYFNDLRKFGWIRFLKNPGELEELVGHHGVDALSPDFTLKVFQTLLARYHKRKIKQLLLDQTLIAGIGNIYADESCFSAKVLPTRIVGTLTDKEMRDLHRFIPKIMELSIKQGGTSADRYIRLDGSRGGFMPFLNVYGRVGKPCKRCHTPIKKIKLNQRGTQFCPNCQK